MVTRSRILAWSLAVDGPWDCNESDRPEHTLVTHEA